LIELEKDLALVMRPRSIADRLVLTEVLVEAGLTPNGGSGRLDLSLTTEKGASFRDGLMVAMLALHSIRLKNFASLEIGRNLANIDGCWWIALSATETKERRPDERRIDDAIVAALSKDLKNYRPVLAGQSDASGVLWLSSNNGGPMTYHAVADVIERTTRRAIGVGIGPHMFRTSAASSTAVHAGPNPHLASARFFIIATGALLKSITIVLRT
jgi:hypothetical protein